MKKILSLILAGLMTVSCAAFVAADDAAVEATTDPVQDYAIEFLSNCGVFKGGEGLTNEDLIQRYQMALFVSRISTGWVEDSVWEDGTANDATFKDIDTEPANKYLGALSYANQNGIIEGYTANTFAPYASITYRDALTMVVRTLGYKGLSYPWGNIEKAVELGLTEGIDAAYTDELTRGEVAVIIYNAMFAKNSKGETLAKSIFGYDFGFQNIVIVSTDEYGYAANGDRAAAGYVGFKTIDENGVLGSKIYYVKASEFGFEGHEEELAVGEVFVALFEIDGDYTNLLDVASLKTATVMNDGITDNEGKAYETMPIAAALKDYTLVKDYTNGILNYTYDDLRVYAYGSVEVIDADGNAAYVGIDNSHNIVKWTVCSESTHGTANTNCKCAWEIAWFYNEELDRYYDYIVDADNSKRATGATADYTAMADGRVYINWMSPDEFTEWYNGAIKKVLATYSELKLQEAPAAAITNGKAPYAKLNLFNIDNDDKAEIATYKSYSIGLFSNTTVTCGKNADGINHTGVKMPAYKLTDLDKTSSVEIFVEEGHEKHEDDHGYAFGWLNVDPSVTTFDTTKTYTDAVVLYNYNKTTGEIEIVKHITDGVNDDADSKIITGVLQAYSTKNETVTIDGTVYPIDYDNLSGDTFVLDGSLAKREVVAVDLDEQYMQYVTAIICDDYVVDIDLRGEDTDAIVVLEYAGITSDGYIAVYGYKTDDLKLDVFKINSYNGWKKGDYRYYPANADVDEAFEFGSLYSIKSYDSATNSYGVYTENVETVLENATPVRITFKNGYRVVTPMDIVTNNDGETYTWTEKGTASKVVAMTDADKYVIVTADGETGLSSNIYVYNGKIDNDENQLGWYFIDAFMAGSTLDSKTLVLYDLWNMRNIGLNTDPDSDYQNFFVDEDLDEQSILWGGAFRSNAYEVGYVLYEGGKGTVLDAAYDDAQSADWYLLGSTNSTVRTMNLLTGDQDYAFASNNIDLVEGHIYKTIGGCIIKDVTDVCNGNLHNFIEAINEAYHSDNLDYANYRVRPSVAMTAADMATTSTNLNDDLLLAWVLNLVDIDTTWYYEDGLWVDGELDLDVATSRIADALEEADAVDFALANTMIDSVKFFLVDEDYNWNWGYAHDTAVAVKALTALTSGKTYVADVVYDVKGNDVVVYIFDEDLNDTDDDNDNIFADVTPSYITGKAYLGGEDGSTICEENEDGEIEGYEPIWTVEQSGKDDRYFGIKVDYKVAVTYKEVVEDEDGNVTGLCKEVDSLELVELTLTIVEMVEDDDVYSEGSLGSCNTTLHDLLAEAGIGFGNINDADADEDGLEEFLTVKFKEYTNGDILTANFTEEDEVVVTELTKCGLIYKLYFDLSEQSFVIDEEDDENGFRFIVMGETEEGEFEVDCTIKFEYMEETTSGVTAFTQNCTVTKSGVEVEFTDGITQKALAGSSEKAPSSILVG